MDIKSLQKRQCESGWLRISSWAKRGPRSALSCQRSTTQAPCYLGRPTVHSGVILHRQPSQHAYPATASVTSCNVACPVSSSSEEEGVVPTPVAKASASKPKAKPSPGRLVSDQPPGPLGHECCCCCCPAVAPTPATSVRWPLTGSPGNAPGRAGNPSCQRAVCTLLFHPAPLASGGSTALFPHSLPHLHGQPSMGHQTDPLQLQVLKAPVRRRVTSQMARASQYCLAI